MKPIVLYNCVSYLEVCLGGCFMSKLTQAEEGAAVDKTASTNLACGEDCGTFSWLMI